MLRVRVRCFVCATPGWARRTFTEDLPGLTVRSARRTLRRTVRLRQIGLALGGQAGARLAQQQHLPTSPDTLLRLVCASVTTTTQERQRQACRAVRIARYEAVRTLHAQGLGIRAIARRLAISRHTVKRFLTAVTFPEQAPGGATTSILDPDKPYLQQQLLHASVHWQPPTRSRRTSVHASGSGSGTHWMTG